MQPPSRKEFLQTKRNPETPAIAAEFVAILIRSEKAALTAPELPALGPSYARHRHRGCEFRRLVMVPSVWHPVRWGLLRVALGSSIRELPVQRQPNPREAS